MEQLKITLFALLLVLSVGCHPEQESCAPRGETYRVTTVITLDNCLGLQGLKLGPTSWECKLSSSGKVVVGEKVLEWFNDECKAWTKYWSPEGCVIEESIYFLGDSIEGTRFTKCSDCFMQTSIAGDRQ